MKNIDTYSRGKWGETIATQHLRKQGHKIIAIRYRTRFSEIDIISQKKQTIYFTEVKYRTANYFGGSLGSITPIKVEKIKKAALDFIHRHPEFRNNFDYEILAIGIDGNEKNYTIDCVNIY